MLTTGLQPLDSSASTVLASPYAGTSPPESSKAVSETATPLLHRKITKQQLFSQLKQVILFKQQAMAFGAICQQTYNIACRALDKKMQSCPDGKKVNLILDIDDCLVECSSYFAGMMDSEEVMDTDRNNAWWEWGQKNKGRPMPGALAFLKKYQDNPKVNIVYLTSRSDNPRLHQWTVDMLRHHGFPVKEDSQVRIAHGDYPKDKQIEEIQKLPHTHDTLLMGDKLSDFGAGAPKGNTEKRREWVHHVDIIPKWGRDFIVVPNPVYGMWETLTHKYQGDPAKTTEQRCRALRWDEISSEGSFEDEAKSNESIQGLLYVQSPSHDAYMLQLSNIACDIAEEMADISPEARGVMMDIDGTALSNSRWRATLCMNGRTATQVNFNLWAQKAKAEGIAGMKALTKKLHTKGLCLYWVTNRPQQVTDSGTGPENSLRTITRNELTQHGFMTEADQLLMREDYNAADPETNRSKESRFQAVKDGTCTGKTVTPVMYFGDAMMDFGINAEELHGIDPSNWPSYIRDGFGCKFFVCPNPPFSKGWFPQLKNLAVSNGEVDDEIDGKSLSDRLITHWHLEEKPVMVQPLAA